MCFLDVGVHDVVFADGIQPIIDPFFKTNQGLEKGIYVEDIEVLKKQAAVNDKTTHS